MFIGLYVLIISMAVMFTAIAIVEVKASFCDTAIKREKRVQKNSIHRRKAGTAYIYVARK